MKTTNAVNQSYRFFTRFPMFFASLPWSRLLIIALIPISGVLAGYVISTQNPLLIVALVAAVPVGLLLLRDPFNGIIIWLLVGPFCAVTFDTTTRMAYWIAHRSLLPLALVIALVVCLIRRRLRIGLVELSILLYLLINVFSVLSYYTTAPTAELFHVYDLVLVGAALFWLIRLTAPREAQLKRLMIAVIIMGLVQGTVGLMMNIPATRAVLPQAWMAAASERTTGTLGRDSEFSSTVIVLMLLSAHYALTTRARFTRLMCLAVVLLGSISLVLSFSRATWLATAITVVFLVILYRRLAPYVIVLTVALVLILSTQVFSSSLTFAAERLGITNTVDTRIISNQTQLAMIEAKPVFGWGFGNYQRYQMAFVSPVEGIAVTEPELGSHNTFLSMAVELGLVGLMIYFVPWLVLLGQSIQAYKRLPQAGFYSRRLLIMLWLGAAFWFVVNNFQNIRLAAWGITWVMFLLGLIANVVDASRELQVAEPIISSKV